MKYSLKRALCAALLLAAVPNAALAQAAEENAFPAIAVGMAIPTAPLGLHGTQVPKSSRYVLVDASSAQLFMIEDGRVQDSMRVIVGKPGAATPELNSSLHYATLNPYWNVPADLAQTIIAPRVLSYGTSYLNERGYEVVSDFSANARVLPAASVDWKAVAAGREQVFVRQLPGPGNSMGQIKFGVSSSEGIYLHDTPKKDLFTEDQRNLSNGCVRLEDAPRLARWLLGRDPAFGSAAPEQHVALPRAVPIVITYLNPQAQTELASLR